MLLWLRTPFLIRQRSTKATPQIREGLHQSLSNSKAPTKPRMVTNQQRIVVGIPFNVQNHPFPFPMAFSSRLKIFKNSVSIKSSWKQFLCIDFSFSNKSSIHTQKCMPASFFFTLQPGNLLVRKIGLKIWLNKYTNMTISFAKHYTPL